MTDLTSLMGFANTTAFADYVNTSTELISRIRNRYSSFQSGDVNALTDIVTSAYNILHSACLNNLCSDIYSNCKSQTHATYTAEILVCTGTAIGVGAATVGIGEVLFQLGCGATAIWHYKTMMRGCKLSYQQCLQSH